MSIEQDVEKVLLTKEEIHKRVVELGKEISRDYEGKNLLMVGVLKGAAVFLADLCREVTLDASVDFIFASSYGASTESSGEVKIIKDIAEDLTGIDVLIVEDILDTGYTLTKLMNILKGRNPASLRFCTLMDKVERRKVPVKVDYCGFQIPNEFVIGYGVDYAEKYRNLPYIGTLKPIVYQK